MCISHQDEEQESHTHDNIKGPIKIYAMVGGCVQSINLSEVRTDSKNFM